MSIANELSCDVATALLDRRGILTKADNGRLKEVLFEFHSTLRQMSDAARRRRRARIFHTTPDGKSTIASSSGNR